MSLPQVELLGSGETLTLELTLPKTAPERLLELWQSHLPKNAKLKGLGFEYFHTMSSDAGDETHVSVELKSLSHKGTSVSITHSFLIDLEECEQMRVYWNAFVNALGGDS